MQFVQAIRSSGRSLLALINDILDLSKIQAGKIELHFEPVSLKNIVNDISKIFTLSVQEKGLDFVVETHPSISKLIYLDETRIRQIMFNLIGNAVKFTDNGFVKFKVDVVSETKNEMNLAITVADSGVGIPVEKQEDVFVAFVRNDGGKYPGTGLGLSITKRLVEIMNGTISMKSEQGKGTEFVIKLPGVKIFEGNIKTVNKKSKDVDKKFGTGNNYALHRADIGKTEMAKIVKSDFKLKFAERCIAMKDGHIIKDILACAEDIINYADKHDFKKLKKLGKELKDASESFDVEKIKHLLSLFKTLFNSIN
jgi:two-component sensor histidine kinase